MTQGEPSGLTVSGRESPFAPGVVQAFAAIGGQFVEIAKSYGE